MSVPDEWAAVRGPIRQAFERLVGQNVTAVCIEECAARVLFDAGELRIEGEWQLKDAYGVSVDRSEPVPTRERFDLWRVVGQQVLGFRFEGEVLPTVRIEFPGQWTLELRADDDGLEDWSLTGTSALDWSVVCDGARVTVFEPRPDPPEA